MEDSGVTLLKAEAMVHIAYIVRSQGPQQVMLSSWGSRQCDKATMNKDTEAHCWKPTAPARALLYSKPSGQSPGPWTSPPSVHGKHTRKAHQSHRRKQPPSGSHVGHSKGGKGRRTLGQSQPSRKKTKTTDISPQLHMTHWVSFSAENRTSAVESQPAAAPGSHRKLAPPNQLPTSSFKD